MLVRHEQGAVHAADGYSRSSHKVGVALVTSGPGVTNAVTGIATAYMDSIPMVVLTGQVPTHAIGQDAFQECDTVGITRPCVKHNFLVKDVKPTSRSTIKKAFYLAATGRPGPVLVDIPKDVTQAKTEFSYPKTVSLRSYNPVTKGHAGQIKKAVQLLLDAKRPMVYAGGGVVLNNAAPQLTRLVRLLGFPCTNTLMGLGGFPGTDPQFTGMLGMHGTYESNMAMQHCDVLIAIGARFDDRVIGNPTHFFRADRKIIHIDIDPSSISKRVKVDVPIVGYVADVLDEMLKLIESSPQRPDPAALKAWWAEIKEWQRKDCLKLRHQERRSSSRSTSSRSSTSSPRATRSSPPTSASTRCGSRSTTSSTSRGAGSTPAASGTMGFGLPAAMGVQLVNPGRDGRLRDRRGVDPDVHPGAVDLQAVPPADQGREPQQPLHGHGAAVAAVLLRQPLRRVVHGRAAGFREAGRGVRARRHQDREAGRRRGRAEGGVQAQGTPRVHGLHHRPDRERVPDGRRGGKGLTEMILAEEL